MRALPVRLCMCVCVCVHGLDDSRNRSWTRKEVSEGGRMFDCVLISHTAAKRG